MDGAPGAHDDRRHITAPDATDLTVGLTAYWQCVPQVNPAS